MRELLFLMGSREVIDAKKPAEVETGIESQIAELRAAGAVVHELFRVDFRGQSYSVTGRAMKEDDAAKNILELCRQREHLIADAYKTGDPLDMGLLK